MTVCRHGEFNAHGEPGKDWCPGWMTPLSEPWRAQLEFQMNSTPIWDGPGAMTRAAIDAVEIDAAQVPDITLAPLNQLRTERLTEDELRMIQVLHDAIEGPATAQNYRDYVDSIFRFKPVGWYSEWGERWYDVPIYNSVVDDLGFDPLFKADTGSGVCAGLAPQGEVDGV